jgi:hypothetical protein
MMATIDDVVARVRSFGSEPRIVVHRRGPSPFPLSCQLSKPVPWSVDKVEAACSVSLPSDLKGFWDRVAAARLFEDLEYGQWGLVLWSAEEVIERSPKIALERPRDYRSGDLVVGAFLGESDLLLIRGDWSAPDHGQAIIRLPIDRRAEWDTVGSSFTDFLDRYLRASGDKFWESERASEPTGVEGLGAIGARKYRVVWGGDRVQEVDSPAALEALLDRIAAECEREGKPRLVSIHLADGTSLAVGLGRRESVLNFVSASADPPYFTSRGEDSRDDKVAHFFFQDSWTEFAVKNLIPLTQAREAVRLFAKNGRRPQNVGWEVD